MSRVPHFLDSRLTDGGEIQPYAPTPSTPRRILCAHFCHEAGRMRSPEESNDLISIRTHDLPACSIVLQPTTLTYLLRGLSPQANYTDRTTARHLSAKLAPTTLPRGNWRGIVFFSSTPLHVTVLFNFQYIELAREWWYI
jgi:hypothetical protein